MHLPKFYCINLSTSVERRARMEERFRHHQIDNIEFIEAIDKNSEEVQLFHGDAHSTYDDINTWNSEGACFLAHLKAVKKFIVDGGDECLICEDDIILRNNFKDEYTKVKENVPDDFTLVSMSYMIYKWEGYDWSGKMRSKENLCTLHPIYTWGAQLYLMSRLYALEVINRYDKPFVQIQSNEEIKSWTQDQIAHNRKHTSEIIIRESKGYICYPVLAIEECYQSDRKPEDIPYHVNIFKQWGYNNFSDSEVHIVVDGIKCPYV